MATFVIVHGAWSGAHAWWKVRPLLRAAGHEVFTPALTGLGERAHLATRDVDLDTHIDDVVGVMEYEDLREVVLVGHSYGGVVISGAAERLVSRLGQLVYLDAEVLVPHPAASFSQPVRLTNAAAARLPRVYIFCSEGKGRDPVPAYVERARSEPGWLYRELATGHAPHVTAPRDLTDLLLELVPTD